MHFSQSIEIVDETVRWCHWAVVITNAQGGVDLALGSLIQSRESAVGTAEYQHKLRPWLEFDIVPMCVTFPLSALNSRSLDHLSNSRDVPRGPEDDASVALSRIQLQTAECIVILYADRGDPWPGQVVWTADVAAKLMRSVVTGANLSELRNYTQVAAKLTWPGTVNLSRSEESILAVRLRS